MATFSSLPAELLAHILHLSNEREDAEDAQLARFSFGLISRASFLATADATDFYVAGNKQAKALISKLEWERKWAEEEEPEERSARTTRPRASLRIARVSNVRRLSITLDRAKSVRLVANLLRAAPNLVALKLVDVVADAIQARLSGVAVLAAALGTLTNLRELFLNAPLISYSNALRLLIPLKALEVLDVTNVDLTSRHPIDAALVGRLALPRLRKLGIVLSESPVAEGVFAALTTGSTSGLRILDLDCTPVYSFPTLDLAPLARIEELHWTPSRGPVEAGKTRDGVLALLGSMMHLQRLTMPMWIIGVFYEYLLSSLSQKGIYGDDKDVDTSLLDTLAALPLLRSVHLFARMGVLDDEMVSAFVKAAPSLRTLSIDTRVPWTPEQKERLLEAAKEAGVTFK
ncbi:hypothetical protein RQP46_000153 [Phenoliferia psychrophenolica]